MAPPTLVRIYLSICSSETRIVTGAGIRVADPRHLNEDQDQAFHLNADPPDSASLFKADPDPGTILSVHGWLYFEPLYFDFNADLIRIQLPK
jgi:hypothetical protein